jgi:starvation-inducible DNA-binding protein
MDTTTFKTGLSDENRQKTAECLELLLANTYVLYTKTQVFHWNVEGLLFHSLHEMFEGQYEQLAEAIDEIAERMRMLGVKTPNGLQGLLSIATLKESKADLKSPEMIRVLLEDHEQLCRQLREDIEVADDAEDAGTEDFLTSRLEAHEKTAWMLRSSVA